jgi:hypothetical protein
MSALCQSRPNATQQTPSYFDHLVGAGEQRWRHFEAERFGSLDVHNQLDLCIKPLTRNLAMKKSMKMQK